MPGQVEGDTHWTQVPLPLHTLPPIWLHAVPEAVFGFEGTLVYPYTRSQVRLREDLLATLERLRPAARELGTGAALMALEGMAERQANGSAWLRATFERNHSLADVVRMQSERWGAMPGK